MRDKFILLFNKYFFIIILVTVSLLWIFSANIHSNKYYPTDSLSLDQAWIFNLSNSKNLDENEKIGVDYFYTYGPLAPYFLNSSTNIYSPLQSNITSSIFFIFNIFILFFLLIKYIGNYYIRLIPPITILTILFTYVNGIRYGYDFTTFAILFLITLLVSANKVKIDNKFAFLLSVYTSIFVLFKFNLGIYLFIIINTIITFSVLKYSRLNKIKIFTKQEIIKTFRNSLIKSKQLIIFNLLTAIFTFLLFVVTTSSPDIISFIKNSLYISLGYREYMSTDTLTSYQNLSNTLLIVSFVLPIYLLRKKFFIPYFVLVYFSLLLGWTRRDSHILVTSAFCLFIVSLVISSLDIAKFKSKAILLISLCLIFIGVGAFESMNSSLIRIKPDFAALEYPFFRSQNNVDNVSKDFAKIKSSFNESFINKINESQSLTVLPWAVHLSAVFNKPSLNISHLQVFQSYSPLAEKSTIKKLKENYKTNSLLMHDGTIDGRIYMSEMPLLTLNIQKNYKVEATQENFLLLSRNSDNFSEVSCKDSNTENSNLNKIIIKENLYDKLKRFLYKPNSICLNISDNRGNTFTMKTYKSQLERGIVTSGFIGDTYDLNLYYEGSKREININRIYNCETDKEIKVVGIENLICN